MRYLTFNAIAKRCPNGHWKDPETGECITQAEWKRKYRKNAPGDEPEEKKKGKCPKGYWKDRRTGECIKITEWKDRPKARGNKKNPNGKKVGRKRDITPDTSGTPKAPVLQLTRGWTKKVMRDNFEDKFETADSITKKLEDVGEKTKMYTDFHEEFEKLGINTDSKLDNMSSSVVETVAKDMAGVISEYPLGSTMLRGIEMNRSGNSTIMFYTPSIKTISFCPRYFSKNGKEIKGANAKEEYSRTFDPVVGDYVEKWAFHPHDSMKSQSFSHEYGHLEQDVLNVLYSATDRYYQEHPEAIPEEVQNEEKQMKEKKSAFLEELRGTGIPISVDEDSISNSGTITLTIFTKAKTTKANPDYKKLKEFFEKNGFEPRKKPISSYLTWDKEDPLHTDKAHYWAVVQFCPKDKEKLPWGKSSSLKKLHPLPLDTVLKKGETIDDLLKTKSEWDTKNKVPKAIIAECEELYKELYKVDKIIPSDVYTGYGYYGTNIYWYSKDTPVMDITKKDDLNMVRASEERIAEAYNDVMTRGDKANSMSTLIVSCVEYELARCLSGEKESFSEFIRGNFDMNNAGQPITKSTRYILFPQCY